MEDFKKFNLMKDEPTTASGGTEQDAAHSFTEGPWKVETKKEFIKPKIFEIRNHKGLLIADVNIGMSNVEQNANLIASAPDLLAEFTRLRSELQQKNEVIRKMLPIAKKYIEFIGAYRGWIENDPNENIPDWYAKLPGYESVVKEVEKVIGNEAKL